MNAITINNPNGKKHIVLRHTLSAAIEVAGEYAAARNEQPNITFRGHKGHLWIGALDVAIANEADYVRSCC